MREKTLREMLFFTRRRRHTIWNCDWSSDVCSSDLELVRVVVSPLQLRDACGGNVVAGDPVPGARERVSERQSDVAETDDADGAFIHSGGQCRPMSWKLEAGRNVQLLARYFGDRALE